MRSFFGYLRKYRMRNSYFHPRVFFSRKNLVCMFSYVKNYCLFKTFLSKLEGIKKIYFRFPKRILYNKLLFLFLSEFFPSITRFIREMCNCQNFCCFSRLELTRSFFSFVRMLCMRNSYFLHYLICLSQKIAL